MLIIILTGERVEALPERIRLVDSFKLGRVGALSYLLFLQHFQPHVLQVCLFYTVKFRAIRSTFSFLCLAPVGQYTNQARTQRSSPGRDSGYGANQYNTQQWTNQRKSITGFNVSKAHHMEIHIQHRNIRLHSIITLKTRATPQRPLLIHPIILLGHHLIHPLTHTMCVGCHLSPVERKIGSSPPTRHQAIWPSRTRYTRPRHHTLLSFRDTKCPCKTHMLTTGPLPTRTTRSSPLHLTLSLRNTLRVYSLLRSEVLGLVLT